MPNHKSRHKAIGPQVSSTQRLTEQITTRQALNYHPSEQGKHYMRMDSKTLVLVPNGIDEEAYRVEWLTRRDQSEYKQFNKAIK